MSARKRKSTAAVAATPDAQAFTVVLEDLRSRFQVFGEALQGLRENIEARFEQVDARFEQVEARFEQVEARLGNSDHQIGLVKLVLIEQGRELKEIRQAVGRLETKLDDKVDRVEVVNIVEASLSQRR